MFKGRILVVDDDEFYHEFCREILGEEGHQVKSTYTGDEALELLKHESFDIVLLDLVMPGADGIEILEQAKRISPRTDVVIMTGYASVDTAVRSLKSGAADYLTKPLNPEELKLTVKRIIELRHLFDENTELRNLLTLYEACQRVSLCLELDKLYHLSLDAVLQALQGDLGLSFFSQDDEWTLKASRGLEEEEAELLMKDLLEKDLKEMPGRVMVFDQLETAQPRGAGHHLRLNSALVLPVALPRFMKGMVVAFRTHPRPPFDRMDLGTARFIAEQIHLSFENAVKYQDARRLVFVDDLTGLFNIRYLDMVLQNELKRARRFKNSLSVLFIDLDYFKNVNDTYGHLAGSRLLAEVAKVLKSCVREIDVVVRYGGDEFVVVLVETDQEGAEKVAERIRKTMEGTEFELGDGLKVRSTCCVGVATFPDDAENKTELIHLADKAMYRGKETTRNVVYTVEALRKGA